MEKNIYGYDSFLDVKLPPGETMIDVREPRKGDRWLAPSGTAREWDSSACVCGARIILAPKPTEEEQVYGKPVVIPGGWERVKFDVPTNGDNYIPYTNPPGTVYFCELDGALETYGRKRVIVRKVQSEEERAYEGTVPPIPAGYKRIGFGTVFPGNYFLSINGTPYYEAYGASEHLKRIILGKITKKYAVARVELPEGFTTYPSSDVTGTLTGRGIHSVPFQWSVIEE